MYNQELKKHAQKPYQLIYINLISPIKLIGFSEEYYFFTFTNNCTKMTNKYTDVKKNNRPKYLRTYYNFCKIQ